MMFAIAGSGRTGRGGRGRLRRRRRVDAPVGLALVAAIAVGALASTSPTIVFGVVMASSFVQWRVGPSAIELSVSDATLTFATVLALAFTPWSYRRVRSALGGLVLYEAVMLVVVVAHPTGRALFEWTHRIDSGRRSDPRRGCPRAPTLASSPPCERSCSRRRSSRPAASSIR